MSNFWLVSYKNGDKCQWVIPSLYDLDVFYQFRALACCLPNCAKKKNVCLLTWATQKKSIQSVTIKPRPYQEQPSVLTNQPIMKHLTCLFILFFALTATHTTWAVVNLTDYASNMVFYTWNAQGSQMNFTFDNGDAFKQMCPPPSNWSMVSHAWMENFQKEAWPKSIVDSFIKLRGGCVMFLDYK